MAKKLSVNAPCPCKSGKKIKKCCGEPARRWRPVDLGGGVVLSAPPKIKARAVTTEEHSLPHWLLALARNAADDAGKPSAGNYHALMALLLVTTAGEAIVNRLLEPLVAEEEWIGSKEKKGLEWKSSPVKWAELSKRLGVDPPLRLGEKPLQGYARAVEARNALVHFRHSKNLTVSESDPVEWVVGEQPEIGLDELATRPKHAVATPQLGDDLEPAVAAKHFDSLRQMVEAVMERLPDELAHVREQYATALTANLRWKAREDEA
jgi:hypothetical protein